jgi:hypothetical protein
MMVRLGLPPVPAHPLLVRSLRGPPRASLRDLTRLALSHRQRAETVPLLFVGKHDLVAQAELVGV